MNNNKLFFLLVFVFLICNSSSCLKKNECKRDYYFEFPIELSPAQTTYAVGDTIWISLSYLPDSLPELNSNTILNIDDFDLSLEMGITKFDDTLSLYGIDFFDVTNVEGNLIRSNLVGLSIYNLKFNNEDIKQINFALIPKSIGFYSISFLSVLDTYGELEITEIDCKEFIEKITFLTNNGADNGYNLYVNNIESLYSDITIEEYKKGGIFTFIVE